MIDEVVRWPRPPVNGHTAEDLDRLPDLPRHTQLIDGSLVFAPRQQLFHTLASSILEAGLRRSAGSALRVRREMLVLLGPRQRLEPDVLVVKAAAECLAHQTAYRADEVVLAVEVMSRESQIRDRERKPQLYAGAGIPHFWRVEDGGGGRIVLYGYELDPATRAYGLTGIHRDRIKVTVPFPIDIDLTEIERL